MVLSHRKRYIYFVIPKCGSKTIRTALKSFTDIGYPVSPFEQHLTMREFEQTDFNNIFNDYFKFTFVRNPYDRIYSGFLQDLHASKNYDRWITCKSPIFNEIGEDFNNYIREYVVNNDITGDWKWVCFCPMYEFTHLNGTFSLDFYGRTENLEGDFKKLCEIINIDTPPLFNLNVHVAPQKSYKYLEMYDRKTVEIVNELYYNDFVRFNYEMLSPSKFPIKAKRKITLKKVA